MRAFFLFLHQHSPCGNGEYLKGIYIYTKYPFSEDGMWLRSCFEGHSLLCAYDHTLGDLSFAYDGTCGEQMNSNEK